MKKKRNKTIALTLIFFIIFGLSGVGRTEAYFSDTETASENGFTAGYLDFDLSVDSYESSIGLDETISKSTVLVNTGGMDFQYKLRAEEIVDEDGFCNAFNLQAKLNGVEKYDGDLNLLDTSAETTLGTWKFNVEWPVDETSFSNGDECQFDVVFEGWQTEVGSYGDGGFSDEERMSFTITAEGMVVLNEFLPHPDGIAYGFDFGNDSSDMPQGEWIELYNNSDESIDLDGWYIWDASGSEDNKVYINEENTAPATTTIAGNDWLVVYMNKAVFNNTGDSVRLYNADNVLIDSHDYDVSDFCEIEPTPGDENSTDATGGDCGDVPPNKSYARIPDGIGEWVDPIPTPGGTNVLEIPLEPENLELIIGLTSSDPAESGETDSTESAKEIPVVEEEISVVEEETTEVAAETPPAEAPEEVVEESTSVPPVEEVVVSEEPAIVEEPEIVIESVTAEGGTSPEAVEPEPTPVTAEGGTSPEATAGEATS